MGSPSAPALDPSTIDAAPGRPWTLAWTAQVDRALGHHLETFQTPHAAAGAAEVGHPAPPRRRAGGVALIALGSYARRGLCPQSDIDLLLLHDGWDAPDLEALVQAVCYPLWDAGLSVGHAVRTVKEAVRSTGDRIDNATALTDRRLVAGSQGLADDLSARLGRWLRRSGGQLAIDIVAADAERHRRHGDIPGALEPDLKDGNGGLRDLHSLRWAGAILLGQAGLDPLVGARYLGADDRAQLGSAGERLLAARCALHLVGGIKRGRTSVRNTLRLDLQDEVADALGMPDGDVLLRDVGLATRTIAHLHARTWPVLLADATRGRRRRRPPPRPLGPGISLVDDLVEVDADARLADDTALGMGAVAAAAGAGTVLGRRSAMRLRPQVEAIGSLPWDDATRAALLTALRSGRRGLAAMQDADYLGLLGALLPEWERVRGRPQRNPLHTYDLDTHMLQATAWLTDVTAGAIDPHHRDVHVHMEDPDALVLGTWLHDVGKAWPGDHSVAGETIGREWVLHMGFSDECADRVARLIRLHLLLPDVATQRDLDDPAEIERVAVEVGDAETLDGLYLLGVADSRATGTAAWSDWKDLLIRRLYDRVRGLLEGDVGVLARPRAPEAVLRAAAAMGARDEAELRSLLAGLPPRYLRTASAEQLAVHARLLGTMGSSLAAEWRDGPVPSTAVISLVARDRQGMLADIVGVLAANRVDVLEARVFTHADGTAMDWFVVAPPEDLPWGAVLDEMAAGHAGDVDVARAVDRRERARDVRPPALAEPVPVRVSTTAGATATRIEVRGPDSPGVLFRLTRALADLGVQLQGALVATLGPEVRDVFFATGDVPSASVLQTALEPALLDSPAIA